ncbi:hypothetical protein [Rhodobacter sp. JA431]|uniref:hypothetical protein n=1 Tax=Rhodobacter sp. JA431 TaxID=570013 RepID=UPI001483B716|nr:hypothetical protein [Rhodobacter sp. JA431]
MAERALCPETNGPSQTENRAYLATAIITTCRLALENESSCLDDRTARERVASTLEFAEHLMMLIGDSAAPLGVG